MRDPRLGVLHRLRKLPHLHQTHGAVVVHRVLFFRGKSLGLFTFCLRPGGVGGGVRPSIHTRGYLVDELMKLLAARLKLASREAELEGGIEKRIVLEDYDLMYETRG